MFSMINVCKSISKYPIRCTTVASTRGAHKESISEEQSSEAEKVISTPKCKVAIVTGGTTGIGLATAMEILKNQGKGVVLIGDNSCTGREAVECLNSKCGKDRAIFVKANVHSLREMEDAYQTALKTYGQIDIVVNAAGICNGGQWENEVATNLTGTIRGTLLAYRYAGKEGSGKGGIVLNVSGLAGLRPLVAAPTLSSTYSGIIGLSRSFGGTYHERKSGLRVVTLCPGATRTGFIRKIHERGMTQEMGVQLQKEVDKAVKQKPDVCGQAAVHLIKHALSGSVWVIEGSRLFLLDIPDPLKQSRLVAQFL